MVGLRAWQVEAMEAYRLANPKDFLVTATPGAGKTTFALTIMGKLLAARAVNQIIVIVPTDHLRKQWADAAIEQGIFLDPSMPNDNRLVSDDFVGYVATYAQIAANPGIHLRRSTLDTKKTMVVFDEIHHAGDGLSWGDAINLAFENVSRRLCLTGTPFRTSGDSTIPFVRYRKSADGSKESVSNYTYGYKEALEDSVVRPVTFAAYTGSTTWTNSAGDVMSAQLMGEDLSLSDERAAWRTALHPQGSWIPHVLAAADARLTHMRESGMSDAAGMVLASDQEAARAYAKILKKITGLTPVVIISDDNKASKKIDAFSKSTMAKDRWIVAVRMVSEGVDVPRLAVGVWATNYRTPLFFAQAVGRFVRQRKKGEAATVFLPAVRPLLALAAGMEEQRLHVIPPPTEPDDLGELTLEEAAAAEEEEERERNTIQAIGSDAQFAHVLYNGRAVVGNLSAEDEEFLGLPGLLRPEQMAMLLRKRDDSFRKAAHQSGTENSDNLNPDDEEKTNPFLAGEIRKDINRMVSRLALRKNVGHGYIHKKVREAVPGPSTANATVEILEKRRTWLQENII